MIEQFLIIFNTLSTSGHSVVTNNAKKTSVINLELVSNDWKLQFQLLHFSLQSYAM